MKKGCLMLISGGVAALLAVTRLAAAETAVDPSLPDSKAYCEKYRIKPAGTDMPDAVWSSTCFLPRDYVEFYWKRNAADPAAFFSNLKRITRVIDEATFDHLFIARDKQLYTYENFLKGAATVPYLCDEPGESDALCKREFSTMFAHFAQETGKHSGGDDDWREAFYYVTEGACAETGDCNPDYFAKGNQAYFYAPAAAEGGAAMAPFGYYGRGAKQLTYNYNYVRYSLASLGSADLLGTPYRVAQDGYLAMATAFWFYMTPISQKPSMHQVAVPGLWEPNEWDRERNITKGFGATINIINGGIECKGREGDAAQKAANRIAYYNHFLDYFALPHDPQETLDCGEMAQFTYTDADVGRLGSAAYNMYYTQWRGCSFYFTEVTPFSIYDTGPIRYTTEGGETKQICASGADCCEKLRDGGITYELSDIKRSE